VGAARDVVGVIGLGAGAVGADLERAAADEELPEARPGPALGP
jgi:hypothetical protein